MGRTLLEDMLYLMGYLVLVIVFATILCIPFGFGVFVLAEKLWKPVFWPLLLIVLAGCGMVSYRVLGHIESAIAKRGGQAFPILGQLGFLLFLFMLFGFPLLNFFSRKH